MSRAYRPMPATVLAAARRVFSHVPNVEILSAGWVRDIGTPDGPIRGVQFDVDAWGPTLHGRRLRWTVHSDPAVATAMGIDTPDITDEEAVALTGALAVHLPIQEALAAWAADEGIDEPMQAPAAASFGDVRHLSIDRRLADLMIANRGAAGAAVRLLDLVERMVRSGEGNGDASIVTDELDTDLQAGASFGDGFTTIWLEERLGAHCRLDGDAVHIDAGLPDTLLDAAAGRRLGDIVATGVASLDGAVVASAEPGPSDDTRLELACDRVRIEHHRVLRAAIPGG